MTKKLAPCLWKKPRKAYDRRTLKAVQRWLLAAADAHSAQRERIEKIQPLTASHDTLIVAYAKAAVALREMVRTIDLKLKAIP